MKEIAAARYGGLFATPVMEHVWSDAADINGALRDSILAQERSHPGESRSNLGGWHSAMGRLEFCGAAGRRLVEHMRDMVEEATGRLHAEYGMPPRPLGWVLSAWANVNRAGDSNNVHTHPGATWSGVYYVDPGDSDPAAEGTAIELSDPSGLRRDLFFPDLLGGGVRFRPLPGLMILFPSHVPHAVPPHRGDRPRISVAFNLRKDPFP